MLGGPTGSVTAVGLFEGTGLTLGAVRHILARGSSSGFACKEYF